MKKKVKPIKILSGGGLIKNQQAPPKELYYILKEDGTIKESVHRLSDPIQKIKDIKILDTRVSTAFLGISHGKDNDDNPILFETMVFSDIQEIDGYTLRYTSLKQALAGHSKISKSVRKRYEKLGIRTEV